MSYTQQVLELLGRDSLLFSKDIEANRTELLRTVENSRFLVIGSAGTIG